MLTRDPKPATYLAAVLATEDGNPMSNNPGAFEAARDAETLVSMGRRAARIAEQRCNGIQRYDAKARQFFASWTEKDEERANKSVSTIEVDAAKLLWKYGATEARANGDPRGFVLTFRLASGRSNSFGGGVWGV